MWGSSDHHQRNDGKNKSALDGSLNRLDDDWHGSIHDLQHAPELDEAFRDGYHFHRTSSSSGVSSFGAARPRASLSHSQQPPHLPGGQITHHPHRRQHSLSSSWSTQSAATARAGASVASHRHPRARHLSIDHGLTTHRRNAAALGDEYVPDAVGGETRRRFFSADNGATAASSRVLWPQRFSLSHSQQQQRERQPSQQPADGRRQRSYTAGSLGLTRTSSGIRQQQQARDDGGGGQSRHRTSAAGSYQSQASSRHHPPERNDARPSLNGGSLRSLGDSHPPPGTGVEDEDVMTVSAVVPHVTFDLSTPEPLSSRISSLPLPNISSLPLDDGNDDIDDGSDLKFEDADNSESLTERDLSTNLSGAGVGGYGGLDAKMGVLSEDTDEETTTALHDARARHGRGRAESAGNASSPSYSNALDTDHDDDDDWNDRASVGGATAAVEDDAFRLPDAGRCCWIVPLRLLSRKHLRDQWQRRRQRPCRCITMHQVAVFVVRYAPCFCCCGFKIRTDRLVLGRLNVLLAFFALYQMGAAIFLAIILLNPRLVDRTIPEQVLTPVTNTSGAILGRSDVNSAIWNCNGYIYVAGVAAVLIFTSAILTWRVVRYVNLVGAIRYLWALNWSLPFETFCMICLLDYHSVTSVWVTHWWSDTQMAWFRERYCEPGTANTLCTVPYIYKEDNGDVWCKLNYNSTGCIAIRDAAQHNTNAFLRVFYTFSAIWCLVYIFLVLLTIDTLEHIITKPLVQKSIQSNLPGWLSLPMAVCALIGCVLILAGRTPAGLQYLGSEYSWIRFGFFAVAGLFFVAILSGWFINWSSIERTIDKQRKLVAVHLLVGSMIAAGLLLIAIFGTTISFSVNLVSNPISDDIRGTIACALGSRGECTQCELQQNRCPEWTIQDVATIYKTQALGIAACAAIFCIYAVRAARFGFIMRGHLLSYQIEYV